MIRGQPSRKFILASIARRSFSSWTADSLTGVVSTKGKGSPLFQTVIGLEIHAQLDIPTKLFSGCPLPKTSSLHQPPNTSVWPFDVGVPGFLPRVSQEAVQAAVLSAVATKCRIPAVSRFERKHYFYADSPLGYQITQQRWPLAREGVLVCQKEQKKKRKKGDSGDTFSTRIERIQLEQDTGKTINTTHDGITESLVDFNRAGCALIGESTTFIIISSEMTMYGMPLFHRLAVTSDT
jgi:aspartyl-tRNA(Asn)/glutamyl-tRNA(Gln) amidotransferase subunit B